MSSRGLALGFVALLAVACTTEAPPPTLTQADAPRGCALGVPGATVVAVNTPEGIALSFTSKDRPGEMRERANDAAAQHGPGEHVGRGHDGQHGSGGDHGLQLMQLPPSRSIADDIENGARIRFAPADAADKEGLRAKLRDRASAMNAQSCK